MNPDKLEEVVRRLARAGVGTFEYEEDGCRVLLRFGQPSNAYVRTEHAPEPVHRVPVSAIAAPRLGHFLTKHPLEAQSLVSTGERVRAGQQVGFIAVDDRLYAVCAQEEGVLGPPCIEPGTLVGYGANLFVLDGGASA